MFSDAEPIPDDETAVRRTLSGEREAFRMLVLKHQSAVCATIRALRPHSNEWEDLAQEAFLAAYRNLSQFDPSRGSFRTWILAIARNCSRNAARMPGAAAGEIQPEPADDRTPDVLAAESEAFARLDAGLAALPDEQRLVFVLVELQGLSYAEAAEIAEIGVGTVKSRLFRAKEWLREFLQPASTPARD